MFSPPLIRFWLILTHILHNWSIILLVSTRTPQSLFYFASSDNWQTESWKSLSDLSPEKLHSSLRKKSPYSELLWSTFFMHFPAFGLNAERYGVSLRIQYECRKMRTRKSPNTDTFDAVNRILLAESGVKKRKVTKRKSSGTFL